MQNTVDLDAGHSYAGQRAEQHAAQGIPQRNAVSPLQRLYDKRTFRTVATEVGSRNIRLLNLNHSK